MERFSEVRKLVKVALQTNSSGSGNESTVSGSSSSARSTEDLWFDELVTLD